MSTTWHADPQATIVVRGCDFARRRETASNRTPRDSPVDLFVGGNLGGRVGGFVFHTRASFLWEMTDVRHGTALPALIPGIGIPLTHEVGGQWIQELKLLS